MAFWREFLIIGFLNVLLLSGARSQISNLLPQNSTIQSCNLADGREGMCVYAYLCQDNVINTDGTGMVDLRFSDDCEDYFLKCCSIETPCADSKGTCLPTKRCGVDLNDARYRHFKDSDECEWGGYQCCPNDGVRTTNPTETECDDDSICVPDAKCLVQPDGGGLIAARGAAECSGLETCCPRSQVRKSDSSPCEAVGGRCVRQGQCGSSFGVDIRMQSCDEPDFECCMDSVVATPTPVAGKSCAQSSGICIPRKECKGTVYKDKDKECGSMVCCAGIVSITTSTSKPPTISTPRTQPVNPGKSCVDNSGICTPRKECRGTVYKDRYNECGGLVCCASTTTPTVFTAKSCFNNNGLCTRMSECRGIVYVDRHNECEGLTCCGPEAPTPPPITPPTTTSTTTPSVKSCFNNNGLCTPRSECRGIVYKDRHNECEGLTCCGPEIPAPPPIVTTTTTTTTPRTPVTPGKSCYDGSGKCTPRRDCKGTVYKDKYNECEGLVCCAVAVEPTRTCNSMKGTCVAEDRCLSRSLYDAVDCRENTVCCVDVEQETKECGYRNEGGIKFNTINRNDGESQFGEFPWVVAIMTNEAGGLKYICGGSLIHPSVVLTSAKCVKPYSRAPEKLTVRAGEWDMGSENEPIAYQERQAMKIISHPGFQSTTLVNSVSLVLLEDYFSLRSTVNTICLPPQNFEIDNGEVSGTGWGTTPQDRKNHQKILKSIDLPYVSKSDCQRILRKATNNKKFKLNASFLCAGGETGRDTCAGDAGSPIMYQVPDDAEFRYYAMGMVSWGVGCGRSGIPAAYTDLSTFREWIDKQMENEGLDTYYYQYHQSSDD